MSTPPLSRDKILEIVRLKESGLSNRDVAKAAKVAVGSVSKVMNQYRGGKAPAVDREGGGPDDAVGVPIDSRDGDGGETRILTPDRPLTLDEMYDLFKIDRKAWVPITVTANQWQGFYKIKDNEGTGHKKVALWQTRVTWRRVVSESVELAILDFVREHVSPMPKPKLPKRAARGATRGDPQMLVWGLWDAHLGLYAWQSEVGESMDLTKGVSRICNSVDDVIKEVQAYPIEKIIIPVGNDFMHFDNVRFKTTHGEHHLDVDSRFGKVYGAALRCLAYQIERALELTDDVQVLYVPGNHDLTTSYTLCVALAQRYLKDPRIKFDIRANPRKYITYGGVLLGFDHGQKCRAQQLSLIFATECRELWSKATYREIQIGHTHQRKEQHFHGVVPTNGVTIRTNPSLSNVDAWHHEQGLVGEPIKSVEVWRYDHTGYRGSHVAWARDDDSTAIETISLT